MYRCRGLIFSLFFILSLPCFVFSEVAPRVDITKIDKLEKKISVDFFNAELKDVVKVFTQQTGVNFVINSDVIETKVSMFLDNVSIKEALNSIASAYNLEFYKIPGTTVYRVKEKIAAEEDERITRVYKLRFIKIGSMKLLDPEGGEEDDTETMSGIASGGEGETIDAQSGLVNAITNLLSEDGLFTYDDRANMLIITDYVERFSRIEKVIEALDKQLDQVLIKAELVELTDSLANILGIQYGTADGAMLTSTASTSAHAYPWARNKFTGKYIKEFNFTDYAFTDMGLELGTIKADMFSLVASALEGTSKAKYLSRPRILTLDGEAAIVDITANTAVQQTITIDQETNRETSEFEREQTGIMLRVTPQISGNKEYITMNIEPSVTRAFNSEFFPSSALDVQTRKVRTMVRVRNGDTIAIGGLLSKKISNSKRKIPILGDIPILGAVFTNKEKDNSETDLIVFITPDIIDDNNISQLHQKDEVDWAKKEDEKKKDGLFYKKRKDKTLEEKLAKKKFKIQERGAADKIKEYEKEVRQNPNDAVAHSNLGVAYAKAGKTDPAIEEFKKSILLDSTSAAAYNNLGNLYRIKKEYRPAITCLRKAVELVPDHPYAYTTLGLCYEMQDMFDDASLAYKNAIKYAPSSEWTNTARDRLSVLEN